MSYLNDLTSQHEVIRNRAQRVVDELSDPSHYSIDEAGVLRNKIGRVATSEIRELALHVGVEFDNDASDKADAEAMADFFAEYKENQANRSDEQRAEEAFEMRAAFGPGETVVNVITGETTRT